MITQPIVLVLGAGASKPYGFPLGLELKKKTLRELIPANNTEVKNRLSNLNFDKAHIVKFYEALRSSGVSSVDAFLEHNRQYIPIGKCCMAMVLMNEEADHFVFPQDGEMRGWYQYLFDKMQCAFDSFIDNRVSFITFNYDRSLEYFLFSALKNLYAKDDEECAGVLKEIPIVHVHGKLGNLPWQGHRARQYMQGFSLEDVKLASDQMIIASDADERSEEFQHAYDLICEGQLVYFLGFGYHEDNLRRLGLQSIKGRKFYGTGLGLGGRRIAELSNRWRIEIRDRSLDVYHFIKEHVF